jgi:hypothetical protein
MNFRFILKEVSLLILLLFSVILLKAQQSEYVLKAVALEKIAIFVNWPEPGIHENVPDEFVIAVLGKNPFGDILEETYRNKQIKDRKVIIVYIQNIQKLTSCDILFIPEMRLSELQSVLIELKGKTYLTVSDTEGFAEAGCFVNFYTFENKLRFEINLKAMTEAGFTVDYRLLRVSKVLNPLSQ